MPQKINISKDYLQQEYIEKYRTAKDIAKDLGVSGPTVIRSLIEYGIPMRGRKYLRKFLEGTKYKNATIINRFIMERRQCVLSWNCLCNCGKRFIATEKRLGDNLRCRQCKIKTLCYKEIPLKLWTRIIHSGRSRDLEFDITLEYIWDLYVKQDRKCSLTGVEIEFVYDKGSKSTTASLDRIDSSKGYIIGNVQWVYKPINMMKQDFTQEEFINYCQMIVDFNKNKVVN